MHWPFGMFTQLGGAVDCEPRSSSEYRYLAVPPVLTVCGVVVAVARARRRLNRGQVREAGRTACQRGREIRGRAGRDRFLQEVHVVLDLELLPVRPNQAADPPLVRRREP